MSISILIPAYNEADKIGDTVRAACQLKMKFPNLEVIVVDDGSTDKTSQVSQEAGADIVHKQRNGGKGEALRAALSLSNGEILLPLDADLGSSASEAEKLLLPILQNEADMSIALFVVSSGSGGGMGLAVRLASWGIQKLTGRVMRAPLSGQRAFRRTLLEKCGGFASGWGVEVGLTVRALQAGFRLLEVPTSMTHRVTGRSLKGIVHRASQFFSIARTLIGLKLQR